MYEKQRSRLIEFKTSIVGVKEWYRRLEEEDGGICTALGLYGSK